MTVAPGAMLHHLCASTASMHSHASTFNISGLSGSDVVALVCLVLPR